MTNKMPYLLKAKLNKDKMQDIIQEGLKEYSVGVSKLLNGVPKIDLALVITMAELYIEEFKKKNSAIQPMVDELKSHVTTTVYLTSLKKGNEK